MTRLEFLRRTAGLSQLELGRRIGINATSIVQFEHEYRKPWPKFRRAVAEFFGVEESELFDAEGWPLPVDEARVLEKVAK